MSCVFEQHDGQTPRTTARGWPGIRSRRAHLKPTHTIINYRHYHLTLTKTPRSERTQRNSSAFRAPVLCLSYCGQYTPPILRWLSGSRTRSNRDQTGASNPLDRQLFIGTSMPDRNVWGPHLVTWLKTCWYCLTYSTPCSTDRATARESFK